MSYSCLRRTQTHSGPTCLRHLDASARLYGTKPNTVQPSAHSRGIAANNNVPNANDIERATNARHWLRAILRECTYLPDPKARQYVGQYVLSRFRTYQFKIWRDRNKKSIPGFEGRLSGKENELRLFHRLLCRANEGETKPLLKLLFMTYGRTGKRRHDLMGPLLAKEAPERPEPLVQYNQEGKLVLMQEVQASSVDSGASNEQYNLSPVLRALLRSQQQADPPTRTRLNPRRLSPDIPALNSKMRAMPVSRAKNLTRKWYADLLDRVLPPLPADEWHQLQALAKGQGISKQPARRTAPGDCASTSKQKRTALDMVLQGKPDRRLFGNPEAHAITPRYMRRLYALVFKQCPLMDFDSEKGKWSVTWGKNALSCDPSENDDKSHQCSLPRREQSTRG